jgi:hypothetical protein
LEDEVKRMIADARSKIQQGLAVLHQVEQSLHDADASMANARNQVQQSLAVVQRLEQDLHGSGMTMGYISELTEQLHIISSLKAEHKKILAHTPLRLPMPPRSDISTVHSSRRNSDVSLFDNISDH